MGRVIVITSGKGGVGKTTITANIGIMLASCGKKVCLVDSDIGLNNLDVVLGLENKIVYDLLDCVQGRCRPTQALIQDDYLQNLFFLPCAKTIFNNVIDVASFSRLINSIKDMFDFVIIDCPAGIGRGFEISLSPADEAIVACTPTISSVRDADKVLGILACKKITSCLIINRVRADMILNKDMLTCEQVENLLKTKTCGIIPESDELSVYNSFLTKMCSFKDKDVQMAFALCTKNIINYKFDKYNYLAKYKGLFGYFRRKIKKRA